MELTLICRKVVSVQRRISPRARLEVVRLTWVTLINSFFVIMAGFNSWKNYAGIGLPKAGFQNVGYVAVIFALALALGIVLEARRVRGAAVVNVGLYAICALDVFHSVAKGVHIDPLAWVAALLFASISVVNLLLYLGVSPLPFGD